MLIGFGSVKGSPGATTWAVAMAARWPHAGPAPVVVELDVAGGDLGSRWHLHDEPGLAGLVTAVRHQPIGTGAEFVQQLPIGVDVVVAAPADAAAATVAEFAARGPAVLRELSATRPVFADLGRLDPLSPTLSYLDAVDEVLMVARPVAEELRHLRARVPVLAARGPLVRLVLVGTGPYRPAEIATYLQVPVAAVAPSDPVGAGILAGRKIAAMGWTRRPLLSAARTFALTYRSARLQDSPPVEVATDAGRAPESVEVTG
jgi:hypothetical protein